MLLNEIILGQSNQDEIDRLNSQINSLNNQITNLNQQVSNMWDMTYSYSATMFNNTLAQLKFGFTITSYTYIHLILEDLGVTPRHNKNIETVLTANIFRSPSTGEFEFTAINRLYSNSSGEYMSADLSYSSYSLWKLSHIGSNVLSLSGGSTYQIFSWGASYKVRAYNN